MSTAPWFHENWIRETLKSIERSLDSACDRWRSLYRAAVRQRELHHSIIGDHSRPEAERAHSRRLRAQAEGQIKLLTEPAGAYHGDFYSYRYFAAEGFLPGYNFPRLPLSAYVPGRRLRSDSDEFISRPRFLAISEFGPRALVYHEGARYRVYKVNLDFGAENVEAARSLATETMKRCARCGYAHVDQSLAEICARCGTGLDGATVIDDLVRMQNVSLRLAQRITCDEEERQRFGYRLVTAYRFAEIEGKLDRSDSEVVADGTRIMRLSYGDAAALYRINLGWANRRPDQRDGFRLDLEKGYWARNSADDEDRDDATAEGRNAWVVPYVTDTKNALAMSFEPPRREAETAALQAAFKEAIQKHYQLEPRELSSEAMPSPRDRREILFYEASEGGAGVLRRLVEDPEAVPALARRALEICHFDPDTLADRKADKCGKACYECLLDYGNQPDHLLLDRHAIRDALATLARSETRPAGGPGSRAERLAALRDRCESKLEIRWLDRLDALEFAPAQRRAAPDREVPHATGFLLSRVQRGDLRRRSAARRGGSETRGRGNRGAAHGRRVRGRPVSSRGELGRRLPPPSGHFRDAAVMSARPGTLVRARGREWVVLPESTDELLMARPLGGLDEEIAGILPSVEPVESTRFPPPTADDVGDFSSGLLLREAARLSTRAAAGPFRSFGRIAVEPRPYQLVPLMMALKLDPVRLLIADDVGIGKTVEAAVIARELLDRGEIRRVTVLCPPHLAEQWQRELAEKFHIDAELVLSGTVRRLERDLPVGVSVFDRHRFTVVSTDFIKSPRRADDFIVKCPEFVIVDEAHGCTPAAAAGRQRRFELLKRISGNGNRHLLLVTATPHSGNEDAFRSLLGLLDPAFAASPAPDLEGMRRKACRPPRPAAPRGHPPLSGGRYGVSETQRQGSDIQARRGIQATLRRHPVLRARLRVGGRASPKARPVLVGAGAAALRFVQPGRRGRHVAKPRGGRESGESGRCRRSRAPRRSGSGRRRRCRRSGLQPGFRPRGGTRRDSPQTSRVRAARRNLSADADRKLRGAVREIQALVRDGFRPVVFCRFVDTAEYVARKLREALPETVSVAAVTGRLPPAEREMRIEKLAEEPGGHVLVCTDCLSEGINLQRHFNAALHYDLAWNPTRHEQREGRVDRFGQESPEVRVVTWYGADNPVDGVILDVLLRKHKSIKSDLGVTVAVPGSSEQIAETLFEGALFRERAGAMQQMSLDFIDDLESKKRAIHEEWDDARERERASRSRYAQRALKPEAVAAELENVRSAIGRGADVERFVRDLLQAAKVPGGNGERKRQGSSLRGLAARLRQAIGRDEPFAGRFDLPLEDGELHLGRTSPVVEGLAGWTLDQALDRETERSVAARCGVIYTSAVGISTTLLLARFRHHLSSATAGTVLCEEIVPLACTGSPDEPNWLMEEESERLLSEARPEANLVKTAIDQQIGRLLSRFPQYERALEAVARERADGQRAAHARVRESSTARWKAEPALPVDILGAYVLLPRPP